MSTTTARLGLIKPDATEFMDDGLTDFNANADKLDQHAGFFQCTSSTRPASPWRGLVIEETDTDKIWRYNGTTWVLHGGKLPTCLVRKTSDQSLTNSTGTQITLQSLDSNYLSDANDFTLASNQVTIKKAGFYMVNFAIAFAATASGGTRKGYVFYNNDSNPFISAEIDKGTTSNNGTVLHGSRLLKANADDFLRLFGQQNSGGSLNVIGADASGIMGTSLSVTWVRAA